MAEYMDGEDYTYDTLTFDAKQNVRLAALERRIKWLMGITAVEALLLAAVVAYCKRTHRQRTKVIDDDSIG